MNRKEQSGIVLVITLIMLAVVTFMAIIFLAVSRRERSSVQQSEDLTTSRLMADAGAANAQAEVTAAITSSGSKQAFDLKVSRNFINTNGFTPNLAHPTNVSYVYPDKTPVRGDDLLQNIANLQFDPRVPVFVVTNRNTEETEFRYYLDFNRNRIFEDTGLLPVEVTNGMRIDPVTGTLVNRDTNVVTDNFVGDPAWKGVLQHPEWPHSETNRFIGRYAYIVMPSGKTLDLNYIHNQSRLDSEDDVSDSRSQNGYLRNQGYGSWELNMAGFLRGLNTNIWHDLSYVDYNPTVPNLFPKGFAFNDARAVLGFRYNSDRRNLGPASLTLNNANEFNFDRIDNYAEGPVGLFNQPFNDNRNLSAGRPWPGNNNPFGFYDVQELYTHSTASPLLADFATRLNRTNTANFSTYDRYTFYRLLAQMGVDSTPALGNKLHLNYTNTPGTITTNLRPWTAIEFFTNAANLMLRQSIYTNIVVDPITGQQFPAHLIGNTIVRPDISVHNIQLYHIPPVFRPNQTSNEYTADIHRILQLAANIYDNQTNRGNQFPHFPTVFRPVFNKTATNLTINGFVEEPDGDFITAYRNLNKQALLAEPNGVITNVNLFGQAVVIGAKKGYPNFNEFSIETMVKVARKIELRKVGSPDVKPTITNQMYTLSISNIFGLESWNSYTQAFRRPLTIQASILNMMALSNVVTSAAGIPVSTNLLRYTNHVFSTNFTITDWPGYTNDVTPPAQNNFLVSLRGDPIFVDDSIFQSQPPALIAPRLDDYDETLEPPEWRLYMTNRVFYYVLDQQTRRVVDYVSLDDMRTYLPISGRLAQISSGAGNTLVSGATGFNEGEFWRTNRAAGGVTGITMGVTNQIAASLKLIDISQSIWKDYNRTVSSNRDESIDKFRVFCGTNALRYDVPKPTSLTWMAPFTPARAIYLRRTWQVNDPLVHYLEQDLNPRQEFIPVKPFVPIIGLNNLGARNSAYEPWGGAPGKQPDATSYDWAMKDPGVRRSDDWQFPIDRFKVNPPDPTENTFKFPNIGVLGQVHRGTPWQTVYLKSAVAPLDEWRKYSGSFGTHPTNDWRLIDLFTVAPNENAARGLLSVNQPHRAAWNAVLAGVHVISNSVPDSLFQTQPGSAPAFQDLFIEPASPQVNKIIDGINAYRSLGWVGTNLVPIPGKVFTNLGQILMTPQLTTNSPYLNTNLLQRARGYTDEAVERIPQQILTLLKLEEPRMVIYSFGQSLRPAPQSISVSGRFYGLCTNYQITGEVITKTVLRVEGEPASQSNPLRTVVENYQVLPPPE